MGLFGPIGKLLGNTPQEPPKATTVAFKYLGEVLVAGLNAGVDRDAFAMRLSRAFIRQMVEQTGLNEMEICNALCIAPAHLTPQLTTSAGWSVLAEHLLGPTDIVVAPTVH